MLLDGDSAGVWIGLRNEDTMNWVNKETVTYTNWSPVEPKSSLTVSITLIHRSLCLCQIVLYCILKYTCVCVCPIQQDEWLSGSLSGGAPLCTVLSNNHNFHFTGKWYDEKCSESSYGFVCEKPQGLSDVPLSV